MAFVFKDGASSTLSIPVDSNSTSTLLKLESVASFPQGMIPGVDYSIATISNSDNTLREVVKITSINYSTKGLFVERGYDSTIPLNWPANSKVEIRAGSTLLKELGISYSPKVLLSKKTFPTSIPSPNSSAAVIHLQDIPTIASTIKVFDGEFTKFRIELRGLYATSNTIPITLKPTTFLRSPKGPFYTGGPVFSTGAYPRINPITGAGQPPHIFYEPSNTIGTTNIGLGEIRYLNGSTQVYQQINLASTGPLVIPASNNFNISNYSDSNIDVSVEKVFVDNQGVTNFKMNFDIETNGTHSQSGTAYMYKAVCDLRLSVQTDVDWIGFSLISQFAFQGTTFASSSLYGIR